MSKSKVSHLSWLLANALFLLIWGAEASSLKLLPFGIYWLITLVELVFITLVLFAGISLWYDKWEEEREQ